MSAYLWVSGIEIVLGLLLLLCPLLILTQIPQWLGKPGVVRALFIIVGMITGVGGILDCLATLRQQGVLILFRGAIVLIAMGLVMIVCPKQDIEDQARRWNEGSRGWNRSFAGPVIAMLVGLLLLLLGVVTYSNGFTRPFGDKRSVKPS